MSMGRKPFKPPEEKLAIVLSVLRGETTQVAIARKLQMSQTTIAKWQKQFLDGAVDALAKGDGAARPPAGGRRISRPRSKISPPPSVRLTWSSGSGEKGGLSTKLRRTRKPPR